MARPRITRARIDQVALHLVDDHGLDRLTLSHVAAALDVGPSALYTHVEGLDGLRRSVTIAATRHLTDRVRTAAIGTAGPPAVVAMGTAYRGFLHQHPGQFASTMLVTGPDADGELEAATASLLEVFSLVYTAMGHPPGPAMLAARSTRSAIHGFCVLEHASGTTADHDEAYGHLLEMLQRGLAAG